MSLNDAVSTVLSRNTFYRDGYRLLLRISLIQGLVIILLIASIVTIVLSLETRYIYFATTADGRIINIVPLNEPYRTRGDVIAWAAGRAQDVMRFGYNDFRQRLQESSQHFSETGWASFTKAMKDARILEAVEGRKLTVALDVNSAPEVRRAFVNEGVYTWILQFPATIRFDGPQAPQPMQIILTLQIVRVSTLQNPAGISIEQWIASPRAGGG